jgi:hypothetical protein
MPTGQGIIARVAERFSVARVCGAVKKNDCSLGGNPSTGYP